MKLYKYLPKEFAEQMTRQGILKIGTLYEYRETDLGPQIGDKEEGLITKQLIGPITVSQESHSDFLKEMNLIFKDPQHIKGSMSYVQSSENLYIYSMSEIYSSALMKDFGYDSCIEIESPDYFFELISKNLPKAIYQGYHKCVYGERTVSYDAKERLHPALIKPKSSHERQAEVRAIWSSPGNEIKSGIYEIPAITNCIKRLF